MTQPNEQDEALARRHAEREKISDEEETRRAARLAAASDHERYESVECVLSAWRFPSEGWKIQITPIADAMSPSNSNVQYLTFSLVGAAGLWRELSKVLRQRGVIL